MGPTSSGNITYGVSVDSFVYVAVILDAWSRRGGRLCNQPLDRGVKRGKRQANVDRAAKPPPGCVQTTIRNTCAGLSGSLASLQPGRLDAPARQSSRQPQGRELHENAQSRSRLPDGIRNCPAKLEDGELAIAGKLADDLCNAF